MTQPHLWTKIYHMPRRLRKRNRYYQWYVVTSMWSKWKKESVLPHYTQDLPNERTCSNEVVMIHNGWVYSNGWADRLRGIVSTYLLCKELGREFRILFTHPFPLELFLLPNTYDWRIDEKDISFSIQQSRPIILEICGQSRWKTKKQKARLKHHLKKSKRKQAHVYTNALFAYHEDFKGAFHELFKPSERLQSAIDRELANLGNDYVSVSARFMGVLGDFVDTVGVEVLPKDQQEQLLQACITTLEKIHRQHPDSPLLVNSDSTTFLDRASQLPYVYTIPGHILHLDVTEAAMDEEQLYHTYEKTFLDFFMIAHATEIYRLQGQWMRSETGFPYAASLVYGRPFHEAGFSI